MITENQLFPNTLFNKSNLKKQYSIFCLWIQNKPVMLMFCFYTHDFAHHHHHFFIFITQLIKCQLIQHVFICFSFKDWLSMHKICSKRRSNNFSNITEIVMPGQKSTEFLLTVHWKRTLQKDIIQIFWSEMRSSTESGILNKTKHCSQKLVFFLNDSFLS